MPVPGRLVSTSYLGVGAAWSFLADNHLPLAVAPRGSSCWWPGPWILIELGLQILFPSVPFSLSFHLSLEKLNFLVCILTYICIYIFSCLKSLGGEFAVEWSAVAPQDPCHLFLLFSVDLESLDFKPPVSIFKLSSLQSHLRPSVLRRSHRLLVARRTWNQQFTLCFRAAFLWAANLIVHIRISFKYVFPPLQLSVVFSGERFQFKIPGQSVLSLSGGN